MEHFMFKMVIPIKPLAFKFFWMIYTIHFFYWILSDCHFIATRF